DQLTIEAAAVEVPADRLVPVAALCEGAGARPRQATVVDVTERPHRLDRLEPSVRVDSPSSQVLGELGFGAVAPHESACRGVAGGNAEKRRTEGAGPLAVERGADVETGCNDGGCWDRPPGLPVELDAHAVAALDPQRRDSRHPEGRPRRPLRSPRR